MEGRRSRTLGSDVPRVPGTGEQSTEDSETVEYINIIVMDDSPFSPTTLYTISLRKDKVQRTIWHNT